MTKKLNIRDLNSDRKNTERERYQDANRQVHFSMLESNI